MALIKREERVSYNFDPLTEGTPVMSFAHEHQATEYVNKLVKGEFPSEAIAIRGTDLFTIEKVTGELNYAKSAWDGFKEGIYYALSFFAVLGFLDGFTQEILTLSVFIGLGYGCVMVIVRVFSAWRGSKSQNYVSKTEYRANRYEVLVNPELEEQVQDAFLKGALGAKPGA